MGTQNQRRLVLSLVFVLFPLFHLFSQVSQADTPPDMPVGSLNDALEGNDLQPLFALIDVGLLADRAGLDSGARSALERVRHRLGQQAFGDYRLYTNADGELLLRLDLVPRGLNWLVPQWQDASAAQPLSDWYDAALGISLSELVAGIALLAESRAGREFLETLDDSPRRAWGKLSRREQRNNPAAARLLLASCGARPCYSMALQAIGRLPQETPALWQLDAAALADDRDAFSEHLAALAQRLGPDPGLAWLAGAEALRYGNCDAVMDPINTAVGNWPDYQALYPVLTQCLVSDGNYAMALNFFAIMEERFGLQFDWPALAEHPVYRSLLASRAFPAWCEERPGCERPADK